MRVIGFVHEADGLAGAAFFQCGLVERHTCQPQKGQIIIHATRSLNVAKLHQSLEHYKNHVTFPTYLLT